MTKQPLKYFYLILDLAIFYFELQVIYVVSLQSLIFYVAYSSQFKLCFTSFLLILFAG